LKVTRGEEGRRDNGHSRGTKERLLEVFSPFGLRATKEAYFVRSPKNEICGNSPSSKERGKRIAHSGTATRDTKLFSLLPLKPARKAGVLCCMVSPMKGEGRWRRRLPVGGAARKSLSLSSFSWPWCEEREGDSCFVEKGKGR